MENENDRTERNRELLESFITDHKGQTYCMAYRLCHNPEDAKDLVQETWYRAWKSVDQYDETRPMDAWFFRILRNAHIDHWRRRAHRVEVSLDAPRTRHGSFRGDLESLPFENGTLLDKLPWKRDKDILEHLVHHETADLAQNAFDGLSIQDQEVLHLADAARMRYGTIAHTLKVPVGTVRSRVFRARGHFRQHATALGLA